ncbi:hypothetical protein GJ496_006254 [Pomphorhynchus laevis]|nr:hypothetical protein GJ496_006254 [Pomphorhynchus laevis]
MPSILIICIISALLCTDRTVAFLDDGAACLKGKWHSETPIKHQNLTGECSIYSNYSCCTDELSRNLSTQGFEIAYGHFMDDLCAYECNPYYHPWIIKDDKYWREERFHKVPLCWTSCLSWYDDCKDDYTCSDNWLQGFNWIDVDDTEARKQRKYACPYVTYTKLVAVAIETLGSLVETTDFLTLVGRRLNISCIN